MKLVIGNLKMNLLTIAEREQYVTAFKRDIKGKKFADTKIVVCPPFVHLEKMLKELGGKNVSIGAQDVFWEEKGSYTGEISAKMLKNIGVEYVIIGHSERRKYFGETNETANLKIQTATKQNIIPVYCVGESQDERNAGETAGIIKEQIKKGLANISTLTASRVVIAYEPIWAVGSDKIPTSDEILEVKILLKRTLAEMFDLKTAEKVILLYGGSVKTTLINQTCIDPGMDGVLVGRESLIPNELIKMAEIIDKN